MSKDPQPPKPQQDNPTTRLTPPAAEAPPPPPAPPTMNRIVNYRVSARDVEQIVRQRSASQYVSHGNEVNVGDVFPMMVIRAWKPGDAEHTINGQAFLDGNDTLWVTTATEGDKPGQWHWPVRT